MSRLRDVAASLIVKSVDVPAPPRSLSFPVPCETCHATSGFPFHAGTVLGVTHGIRIGIRCRACGAEWTIDAHTDTEFLHTIDTDRAEP